MSVGTIHTVSYDDWNSSDWEATTVDFDLMNGKVDLSNLLKEVGYTGDNPVNDGYIRIKDMPPEDPQNPVPRLKIQFDEDSYNGKGPKAAIILNNVTSDQFSVENNLIWQSQNTQTPSQSQGFTTYTVSYDDWNNPSWEAPRVPNFNPAHDKVDVSQLLLEIEYTGNDPKGDHHIHLVDMENPTSLKIQFDKDGLGGTGPKATIILTGVTSNEFSLENNMI